MGIDVTFIEIYTRLIELIQFKNWIYLNIEVLKIYLKETYIKDYLHKRRVKYRWFVDCDDNYFQECGLSKKSWVTIKKLRFAPVWF